MVCQWTANLPGTAPRLNNKFRLSFLRYALARRASNERRVCITSNELLGFCPVTSIACRRLGPAVDKEEAADE